MAEQPKQMPKVAQIPVPVPQQPRPPQRQTEVYDPEVLRIVQADVDRKRKIAELESDRDDWRRAALDAKQEVNRLQMIVQREQKEAEEAMRKERAESFEALDRLSNELDLYKAEVTRIKTCAENGAAVFLQILNHGLSSTPAETVGQQAVANAIDPDGSPDEPMPSIVRAGPRPGE